MNAYTAYTPRFRVRPSRNATDPPPSAGDILTTRERAKPYRMPSTQQLHNEQKEPSGPTNANIPTPETSPRPVIQIVPMPVPILVVTTPGVLTEVSTSSRHIKMPGAPAYTPLATNSHLPTIDRVFHSPEKPVNMSGKPTYCNIPLQQTQRQVNNPQLIPNPPSPVNQAPVTIQLDVQWQTIPQASPIQRGPTRPEAGTLPSERPTFNPSNPTYEEFCSIPTAKTRNPQPDIRPKTPFYCSDPE